MSLDTQKKRKAESEERSKESSLSSLAVSLMESTRSAFTYHAQHFECFRNPYSEYNPSGGISLTMAENKLCGDLILNKLRSFTAFSQQSICYTDTTGDAALKSSLSKFMSERLFAGHAVDPRHLVVSAGCTALLYQLSLTLFNPSDAILIPTPFYPVFYKDFSAIGKVYIQDVHGDVNRDFAFTVSSLQKAYDEAMDLGHPPKALLLTNPHNPMGTIYSGEELLAYIAWCRSKGMHVIFDEIYALSTFGGTFVSVVELMANDLGRDIHVIWGMSKDFGASGPRLGVLYSQNAELLSAHHILADPFQVSMLTQQMTRSILDDFSFIDEFLSLNRERLSKSYKLVKETFDAEGMRVIPAVSSIFVFVDLRCLLSTPSFEEEKHLFLHLASRYKFLS